MANSKSIYLNESTSNRIENIKAFFNKFKLTPSDSSIISAALEVYEKTLKDDDIREGAMVVPLDGCLFASLPRGRVFVFLSVNLVTLSRSPCCPYQKYCYQYI